MKKFEVGMTITEGNTYIITSIENNMAFIKEVQHYGKANERTVSERKCRIRDWNGNQVAIYGKEKTLEAI